MMNPIKKESNIEPNIIERLGDNSYYYNYDIQKKIVNTIGIDNKEVSEPRWSYIQVHLYGIPNHKECIRAIIRSYVTQDEEFDLINSANSINLGVRTISEDKQKYLDYLILVQDIKDKVKKDFNIK